MDPVKSNNDNWSRQICALWSDKCGGSPQVWHLKALRPLIDQYGVDVVRRVLTFYLENTSVEYIGLPSFVSKFGAWRAKAIPQVKVNANRFTPH
jgi:hypothetical protein